MLIAKLGAWAKEYRATIVSSRRAIRTEAYPTPFVAAFLTGYMVAALVFKCSDFALRAWFKIIVSCEVVEFSITNVCTTDSSMSSCTTSHAYILATDTSSCPIKSSASPYIVHASIPWTPTKTRVHINVYVHLESEVLFENIFRAKSFYVFLSKLNLTTMLHARYLDDLAIHDICLQVL